MKYLYPKRSYRKYCTTYPFRHLYRGRIDITFTQTPSLRVRRGDDKDKERKGHGRGSPIVQVKSQTPRLFTTTLNNILTSEGRRHIRWTRGTPLKKKDRKNHAIYYARNELLTKYQKITKTPKDFVLY